MTQTAAEIRHVVDRTGFANPLTLGVLVEDPDYLKVYADLELLQVGVDYTVTGIGDANGVSIEIIGAEDINEYVGYESFTALYDPVLQQGADLSLGGSFGRAFESALDSQNRQLQAVADQMLRVPPGAPTGMVVPREPGAALVWNDEGDGFLALPVATEGGYITGIVGPGVPPGGTTGQVLKKASDADNDTVWATDAGGIGGSTGSTDKALLRSDGTGGATAQGSVVAVDDSGNVLLPTGAALDWGAGDVTLDHAAGILTLNAPTLMLNSRDGDGVTHPTNQIVLRSNDLLLPDGTGGHIRFQTPNDGGTFRDGAEINGGLVDATAGAEDGLFDFSVYRAGTSEVAFTIDASLAAIFPGNTNNVYSLGRGTATWSDLYLGSGGFINWSNSDIQIRHDTNVLFFEGAATGYYFDGPLRNTNATGGIGYAIGAGGTVTQATSKSTGVTLNKATGQITMNAAALAANTTVSFTLTNSAIEANDILVLNHRSGGTAGAYALNAQCAAGSASINVRNITAGSLSEAIVIGFALIKAVTA